MLLILFFMILLALLRPFQLLPLRLQSRLRLQLRLLPTYYYTYDLATDSLQPTMCYYYRYDYQCLQFCAS